jgi:hypothetical protein
VEFFGHQHPELIDGPGGRANGRERTALVLFNRDSKVCLSRPTQ